jgi:hypothetical protein
MTRTRGCEVVITTRTAHSVDYKRALQSRHWRRLRAIALRHSDGRCERCGKSEVDTKLELHHNTYERLGRELPSDVRLLCPTCHEVADRERERRVLRQRRVRQFEAGLETYMCKKYGDDWDDMVDYSDAAEEFEDWLDRR